MKLRHKRQDGWYDVVSGLGAAGGKGTDLSFAAGGFLTRQELEAMYRDDWLARRIVEKQVAIAFADGIVFEGDDGDTIQRDFRMLNHERFAEGAVQRALHLGRLYGGAGLYLGTQKSGPATSPLTTGRLEFLDVMSRHDLEVVKRYDDPQSAKHGLPEVYRVHGRHWRRGLEFHESRLLRTTGLGAVGLGQEGESAETRPEWGISVVQPLWQDLARYGISWAGLSHLLQEASIGVMKMSGVMSMIASEDESTIQTRVDLMNEARTIARMILLDSEHDEEFHREAVNFSNLPQLMQTIMTATAAAAGYPATILFEQSPAGLNATGESDLENFYRDVGAWREIRVRQIISKIVELRGHGEIEIQFPSLWETSDKEKAETRLIEIQGDRALWDMNVIESEHIALARHDKQRPEEIVDPDQMEAALAIRPAPAERVKQELEHAEATRAAIASATDDEEGSSGGESERLRGEPDNEGA